MKQAKCHTGQSYWLWNFYETSFAIEGEGAAKKKRRLRLRETGWSQSPFTSSLTLTKKMPRAKKIRRHSSDESWLTRTRKLNLKPSMPKKSAEQQPTEPMERTTDQPNQMMMMMISLVCPSSPDLFPLAATYSVRVLHSFFPGWAWLWKKSRDFLGWLPPLSSELI